MFTAILVLVLLYLVACVVYGGMLMVHNLRTQKQQRAEEAAAEAVLARVGTPPAAQAA